MIVAWIVAYFAMLGLPLTSMAQTGPVDGETVRRVSVSVVQLRARECEGHDRVATGFVWPSVDRVVTAMHVVVGCRQFSVYHEQRRIERDASVVGVLKAADLALLAVAGAGELPVLTVDQRQPATQEDLAVLGYELGVPTMGSKTLRLSFGASLLRDMLPDRVRSELQNVGFPSLDLKILRLEGHLLPGHSGAPIFDRQGHVVAVGNGGLENGAASISWAVPTAQLDRLRNSSERLPTVGARQVTSLFAASLESQAQGSVRCGGITFTKMRTRSFADITRTSDDPIGLQQLLQAIAAFGIPDMSGQTFDIYVDRASGGTVVLPARAQPQAGEPFCRVVSASGQIRLFVRGDLVQHGLIQAQAASLAFENMVVAETRLTYALDPNWSYFTPHNRFDGLVLNRKTYVGYDPSTRLERAGGFETLITRGQAFIGVAGVNFALQPQAVRQAVQFCQFQPTAPVCAQLRALAAEWALYVLAIHMSTFPIG